MVMPRGSSDPHAGASPRRAPTGHLRTVLQNYIADLATSDLADNTRRGYAARVAGFLGWLESEPARDNDANPLRDPAARDNAVQHYLAWLITIRRVRPATVNATLTALDHFYGRALDLGPARVPRERLATTTPGTLTESEQRRFLEAAYRCETRDTAIGLLLFYTGLRVEEAANLNVDDVRVSSRGGVVLVRDAAGDVRREIPLHRAARRALLEWLDDRPTRRGADGSPALLLSRRGARMGTRAIRYVIAKLGTVAGLKDQAGDRPASRAHPQMLRHTFADRLGRQGVDALVTAELLGRAVVNTAHLRSRAPLSVRTRAIDAALLTVDSRGQRREPRNRAASRQTSE